MLDAPGCVLVACSSFGSKERTSFTDALGHGVLAVGQFEDIGLCPFCVQRYLMRFDLSSFFNVAEKPFVRVLILLSYCLG